MKKILSYLLFIVIGFLLLSFTMLFQPWVFLPHDHLVISLPFAPSDDATTSLIPMGEKIEHNESNGNPDGHPGIDFGFNKVTDILSVSEGTVFGAGKNSAGTLDVTIQSGFYKITYKELNEIDPGIRLFNRVKQGQRLGSAGREGIQMEKPKEGDPSRQIHWEFSSASMFIDRLCPINYFDAESRARIEAIWANVPSHDQFKSQYPEICNGFFYGRED